MQQTRPRILWQTLAFDDEGYAVKIGKVIGGRWIWIVEFIDGRADLHSTASSTQTMRAGSFISYEEAVKAAVAAARDQTANQALSRAR